MIMTNNYDKILNFLSTSFNIHQLTSEMFCILLVEQVRIKESVYMSTTELTSAILRYTTDACRSTKDKKIMLLTHPEIFNAHLIRNIVNSKDKYHPNMNKTKLFNIWIESIRDCDINLDERNRFEFMYNQLNIPNIINDDNIFNLNVKSVGDLDVMGRDIIDKCSIFFTYITSLEMKIRLDKIIEMSEATPSVASISEFDQLLADNYMDLSIRQREYMNATEIAEVTFTSENANDIARSLMEMAETSLNSVIPTGIGNLDKILKYGGSEATRLYLWAATPGGGKSLALSNVTSNSFRWVSQNSNKQIGDKKAAIIHVTMENKILETNERVISNLTGEPLDEIMAKGQAYLSDKLRQIVSTPNADLMITYKAKLTVHELRLILTNVQRTHEIKCVCLDYLDLMTHEGAKGDQWWMAIGDLCRELKILCSEFNTVIHSASQLGRGGVDAERLSTNMIADGFKKINHADVVLLTKRIDDTNTFNISVVKNRNGGIGDFYVDTNWGTYQWVQPRNPNGQVQQSSSSNWASKKNNNNNNKYTPNKQGSTPPPPQIIQLEEDDLFET